MCIILVSSWVLFIIRETEIYVFVVFSEDIKNNSYYLRYAMYAYIKSDCMETLEIYELKKCRSFNE